MILFHCVNESVGLKAVSMCFINQSHVCLLCQFVRIVVFMYILAACVQSHSGVFMCVSLFMYQIWEAASGGGAVFAAAEEASLQGGGRWEREAGSAGCKVRSKVTCPSHSTVNIWKHNSELPIVKETSPETLTVVSRIRNWISGKSQEHFNVFSPLLWFGSSLVW